MSIGRIMSSTVDAQGAIAKLTGLKGIKSFRIVEFSDSDVPSMFHGKELANGLMHDMSKITTCVLT